MDLLGDVLFTTEMVLIGAVIALILSVATSILFLQQGWGQIRKAVVEDDNAAYGILTGAVFVAVCALVGVANRQSITPVWDPTLAERLSFTIGWVLYGQVLSFILCYFFNWLLFGLTPAAVRRELQEDHNPSVAAVCGLIYVGVSMLVVFRIL
ncbi:MAG: hypothetical protein U0821_24350 [Chloroflexota bacterium]